MRVDLFRAKNGLEIEILQEDVDRFKWKKPNWNLWWGPYKTKIDALMMAATVNGMNGDGFEKVKKPRKRI